MSELEEQIVQFESAIAQPVAGAGLNFGPHFRNRVSLPLSKVQ